MKNFISLAVTAFSSVAFLFVLNGASGRFPAVGDLLDPAAGLYYNARYAEHEAQITADIPGLSGEVTVIRDERGVPHIYADEDLDAVAALGYTVARDRLFQMDFIPRVAAGRLSEILGPAMVETDQFLRRTGMDWGARKNLVRVTEQGSKELDIVQAYVRGVNAYIEQLAEKDYPLEFKLLGYAPEPYTEMHVMRILQYMTFDLTFRTDDAQYAALYDKLGNESYTNLFPEHARMFVPIIPERGGQIRAQERRAIYGQSGQARLSRETSQHPSPLLASQHALQQRFAGTPLEGFIPGKGSNNWAVGPGRSETDAPIIAGDMHLALWLPSIWYELHMVTPNINTYGVTIPGAPLPVEGFNDHIGWAYTNSGTDQIDHLSLDLDDSGRKYRYLDGYRDLSAVLDTIQVKGRAPIIDTLYYAHWGPVTIGDEEAIALNWVAHDSSRTLLAQWKMNQATGFTEFQDALRYWDTPMQNIIYGDVDGNIAIRSTGYLPIRKSGHGIGLLDGSSDAFEWVGRVPFDELPYSYNPDQGYLTSTNQQPADSLYPHYQGHDWRPGYRSLRADALLSGKEQHSVDDLKKYQADVYVVQRDLFAPPLEGVTALSEDASTLRKMLVNWEGVASVDRAEPLILEIYLDQLDDLVWDESLFVDLRRPNESRLLELLNENQNSPWFDMEATQETENAEDVMRLALEQTADSLRNHYGWGEEHWRWGDHHKVVFRHLTRSSALEGLWRGPFEYPGFASTLSPASNLTTTHSASWRMVVDFSTSPPTGYGVYPGGQSGNPFSRHYDDHINTYLSFEHFDLYRPESAAGFDASRISSTVKVYPLD